MPKKRKEETLPEPTEPIAEPIITTEPTVATSTEQQLIELVKQLPEAKLIPDDRWYGETFYPQYTRTLEELKKLTK